MKFCYPLDEKEHGKIVINLSEQKLELFQPDGQILNYPISSSKYGEGDQVNSNKTPLGKHLVLQSFGENAPIGSIFKSRVQTGEISQIYQDCNTEERDLITTRIIRLKGLEPNNHNTFRRYIYIHGTPQEWVIGQKVSHGCIRMNNRDICELFEQVSLGMVVEII